MRRALVSDSKAVAIMRSSSFNINQDWLSLLQDTLHDPSAGLGISFSLGLGDGGPESHRVWVSARDGWLRTK